MAFNYVKHVSKVFDAVSNAVGSYEAYDLAKKAYVRLMKKAGKTPDGSPLRCAIGAHFCFDFTSVSLVEWKNIRLMGGFYKVYVFYKGVGFLAHEKTYIDSLDNRISSTFYGDIFDMPAEAAVDFFIVNKFTPLNVNGWGKGWRELYDARSAVLSGNAKSVVDFVLNNGDY